VKKAHKHSITTRVTRAHMRLNPFRACFASAEYVGSVCVQVCSGACHRGAGWTVGKRQLCGQWGVADLLL